MWMLPVIKTFTSLTSCAVHFKKEDSENVGVWFSDNKIQSTALKPDALNFFLPHILFYPQAFRPVVFIVMCHTLSTVIHSLLPCSLYMDSISCSFFVFLLCHLDFFYVSWWRVWYISKSKLFFFFYGGLWVKVNTLIPLWHFVWKASTQGL